MATRGLNAAGTVSHFEDTINRSRAQNGLWKTCPLLEYIHDPTIGFLLDERFHAYDAAATTGDYVLTQAVAGSAALSTSVPGCLSINSGSTTSPQGANVQHNKAAFIPAAGKHIWAEFRVKFTGVANLNVEAAIGLFELDTTVIASSAVSTSNGIGWTTVTDDGVLLFNCEKATAAVTSSATTIVSDTFVNLGFYVNGVTSIQQYINGVATGTAVATANIPIVAIYPTFVCQTAGTDQPIMHIAGYRVFQLR